MGFDWRYVDGDKETRWFFAGHACHHQSDQYYEAFTDNRIPGVRLCKSCAENLAKVAGPDVLVKGGDALD